MWVKFEGNAVTSGNNNDINYHRILSAKHWWSEQRGCEFFVYDNQDKKVGGRGAPNNPNVNQNIVDSWKASEWEFITVVYNGLEGKMYGYNDGVQKFVVNCSPPGNMGRGLGIGITTDGGDHTWDGKMDELRIATVQRSADWIAFAYENQKFDTDLFDFGTVAGPPFFGDFTTCLLYTSDAADE